MTLLTSLPTSSLDEEDDDDGDDDDDDEEEEDDCRSLWSIALIFGSTYSILSNLITTSVSGSPFIFHNRLVAIDPIYITAYQRQLYVQLSPLSRSRTASTLLLDTSTSSTARMRSPYIE